MAWPVTDAQRAALLGSHEMSTSVTVFRGGQNLGNLDSHQISIGVNATFSTQGGRDGYLIVDRNIIDEGLLNPLSDQVIISTGVRGWFQVPIFTGRVDAREANEEGRVECVLLSRGAEAIRAAFESPWAAGPAGTQARAEMAKILLSIDPTWAVNSSNAGTGTIGVGLVWEEDPGQALDQLAQGASLIWQPDRTGGFTIFTNPYSIGPSLGANPVVIFRDGEEGALIAVRDTESRDGIYNSVTVVTERSNNTAPVRVTVRDTNLSSPTRWGGLFGKQNLVVKNQVPLTPPETLDLASRLLRQSLALQRSFVIAVPHMPILDPGDVFATWYRDEVVALVAESITYSFEAGQETLIAARELREIEATEII